MKNVKWIFPVIVAFFGIFSLASCYDSYEDDFDNQEQFDDEGGFSDNENDNENDTNGGGNVEGVSLLEDYGVALYQVDGQNLIKMDSRNLSPSWLNDEVKHNDMWDLVTTLIPADKRRWMTTFEVYSTEDGTLGYVYNASEDLTSWNFALGLEDAFIDGETLRTSGDFIHTVIHEYGHIMALNDEQLDPTAQSCGGYNPGEGCALDNSYLGQFYQRFWADIADEHAQVNEDDIFEFYEKYADRFVSDYSATNPAEDIAEVFAHFVTTETAPTGNQIKDEKIRFLYEYPELVDLRNHMKNTTFALPAPGSWKRPTCRNKHRHAAM